MDTFLVLGIVVLATVLLVTERLRADLVAMLVLALLIVLRLVDTEQALSGFSNRATVTVAAMFIVSAALRSSGLVGYLGDRLLLHGPTGETSLLVLTALVIAPISAFINNTAIVAIFLPIILRACQGNGVSPSRLMMPLSFFAMLGGMCTLVGTTTNILVSSLAEEHGLPPFRMFEFSRLGLLLLAGGAAYFLLVGRHFVPERPGTEDPASLFRLNDYISEVVVLDDSPLIGRTLVEARLGERFELEVVGHGRGPEVRGVPGGFDRLEAGDLLVVKAPVDALVRLGATTGLAVKPERHPDVASLTSASSVLLEAVVTPASDLEGRTLKAVDFRRRFGGTTLAVRRREEVRDKIGRLPLKVGDELLILAPRQNLARLEEQTSFVVLQELDVPRLKPVQAVLTLLITTAVVACVTFGWYSLERAAIVGAVMMVLCGCLSARRVYEAIEWRVVFLLAGLIPLGVALESTGAAAWAVEGMLGAIGGYGPNLVLSGFFLLAVLLTGFMSNTATAALLAPMAISAANQLDVDARPFLIALTFAASAAFWTPIGYQTNLLVYGPGGYRFSDFVRIGGPLTLIYWLMASVLIPVMFPFT